MLLMEESIIFSRISTAIFIPNNIDFSRIQENSINFYEDKCSICYNSDVLNILKKTFKL